MQMSDLSGLQFCWTGHYSVLLRTTSRLLCLHAPRATLLVWIFCFVFCTWYIGGLSRCPPRIVRSVPLSYLPCLHRIENESSSNLSWQASTRGRLCCVYLNTWMVGLQMWFSARNGCLMSHTHGFYLNCPDPTSYASGLYTQSSNRNSNVSV